MKRSVKTLLWILVGPFIALLFFCGIRFYKLSHYSEWFASVAVGDKKELVVQKMGRPDDSRCKPDWLWSTAQDAESEFMYGHSLPPEWWVIGFDSQGKVVCKAEFMSP